MKNKFDMKLVEFNGKPLYDLPEDKTEGGKHTKRVQRKVMTLGGAAVNALLAAVRGEVISGEEKLDRYELAKRIYEAKKSEIEVTVEQIVLIKKCINIVYGPLVYGQCCHMLEGNE
ncbi:hypothetical protein LCGC14_2563890 [marine sediment metagenome]|uniref:Uncharacterized protein n=1 Tax=marine sediment metagenome TaxID=412755 RepID=A0A0F9CVF3_9ZZZZ